MTSTGDRQYCEEVRRRLYLLLDGECDPDESKALENHIARCPECVEEFGSEQALRQLLRRCCQQTAPVELRQRITSRLQVTYRSVRFER